MQIGDRVRMNDKYHVSAENVGKVWTVASMPWNVCGTEVVKLSGYPGCYAVDGLDVVPEEAGNDPGIHGRNQ